MLAVEGVVKGLCVYACIRSGNVLCLHLGRGARAPFPACFPAYAHVLQPMLRGLAPCCALAQGLYSSPVRLSVHTYALCNYLHKKIFAFHEGC